MFLVLFLAVLVAACDGNGSAALPSSSRAPDPPAAVAVVPSASEVPPSATTTPPASEPRKPERAPAVRVAPKTLAVSWSAYLGRRIQLRCRPVRRIDFVRTLITAGGERFVVPGSPDVTPCSATTSTFTVIGSASVAIAGRTMLPELLLEDGDGEEPPR
jgi:hypothetical protein